MTLKKVPLIIAFLLLILKVQAQEVPVPVGALPTQYNGGFAGEAGSFRVANFSYLKYYRYGYSGYEGSSSVTGTFISADHFLKKLSSGVALTAGLEGDGPSYKGVFTSVAISPKFSFNGKYTIAPFANFSFRRSEVNGILNNYDVKDYNLSTGFLINSGKAYMGISADILRNADFNVHGGTYHGNQDRLRFLTEMKYTLQAGYTFQGTPESNFSFTPQLVISYERFKGVDYQTRQTRRWSYITLVDINLMFRYQKFVSGISSTGIVLGYQTNKFKVLLTNLNTNWLKMNDRVALSDNTYLAPRPSNTTVPKGYIGSISLRYVFRKKPTVKMPGF